MDDKIMQLKKWIDESDNVVFFGGAGVSMMNKTDLLYPKFLEDQHFYGIFYPAFQGMFGFLKGMKKPRQRATVHVLLPLS